MLIVFVSNPLQYYLLYLAIDCYVYGNNLYFLSIMIFARHALENIKVEYKDSSIGDIMFIHQIEI